jgi:hypothetical protein
MPYSRAGWVSAYADDGTGFAYGSPADAEAVAERLADRITRLGDVVVGSLIGASTGQAVADLTDRPPVARSSARTGPEPA